MTYSGSGVADILIRYAADGFTQPTNGNLRSNFSGTGSGNSSTSNTASLISCAVAGGTATGTIPCPGGIQAPTLNQVDNVASFNQSSNVNIASIGTPYLLGEQLHVTMVAGAALNFANSTDLVTPEPSSIVLTASGLIGLVGFVRRRKNQA
jgi:hypothetical protein